MAWWPPTSRLNRVDLPTLGRPTRAIRGVPRSTIGTGRTLTLHAPQTRWGWYRYNVGGGPAALRAAGGPSWMARAGPWPRARTAPLWNAAGWWWRAPGS